MNVEKATPLLEGKIYYGLHFAPGIATYQGQGADSETIFISEKVAKEMDQTFPGRPVFIDHIDNLTHEVVQHEAVGYVVESFFNKTDGFHWCKFIITAEEGIRAIEQSNWKLSNAYIPKTLGPGGIWHGADYSKEVLAGEYEHLAIVPNPRYQESIILSPEQFKKYNEQKETDLKRLANSNNNKGVLSMLNFFKKTKVENAMDLEAMSVMLPKSKVEITISKLVNEADDMLMKKDEPKYAQESDMVKMENGEMSVKDLVANYNMCKQELEEMKKKNEKPVEEEKKQENEKAPEDEKEVKNEKPVEEEKKENEKAAEEEAEKKQNHFDTLKNAEKAAVKEMVLEIGSDLVARGKARYGSN